jgi:hypothetical protein
VKRNSKFSSGLNAKKDFGDPQCNSPSPPPSPKEQFRQKTDKKAVRWDDSGRFQ